MESCPGRRGRDLDSVVVRCPECGLAVEIFSDEQKARCRCGHLILREAVPSCLSWCPAAERCFGAVIDLREVKKRIEEMQRAAKKSDYVGKVAAAIEKSRGKGKANGGRGGKKKRNEG